MKEIVIKSRVYGDKIMIVDDEDFEFMSRRKWALQLGVYAQRQSRGKKIYAHRLLMGNPTCMVDHIDGNPLNNQKSNLRLANRNDNSRNCKTPITNKSGYKGVCVGNGKFVAGIYVNNKRKHIGTFDNKIDAAKAYNDYAIKYHGSFARLNKIP